MGSASRKLFYVKGEAVWLNDEEQIALGLKRRQRRRSVASSYAEKKPGTSTSMSSHRKQAGRMNEAMKAHSISGIEWDKNGNCTITSTKARARAMPVLGRMLGLGNLHDADGGYSDG